MLSPGTALGHYKLVERFEGRSKGDVWKAVDTRSGDEVALRLLAFADEPVRMERFESETRALIALAHPGIATVREIVHSGVARIVVTDWVEGPPLNHGLPPGGLAADAVLRLALPLVEAVSAANEKGIVHGDLKPRNVRVRPDGSLCVLDFGLRDMRGAALNPNIDPSDAPTETLTQDRPLGPETLPYSAPERIQMKPLDHRADVWSLGTLIYELATGVRPFEGETPADLIVAVLRDDPTPLSERSPALGPRISQAVRRALTKDRGRRLQSAAFLLEDLRDTAAGKA